MKLKIDENINTGDYRILGEIERQEILDKMSFEIMKRIVEKVSDNMAERIIKERGEEIWTKIDMKAVSNMAIAEAGARIKEILDKKLPDKVERIIEKEVYQRGFFGGVRRVA